MPLTDPRLWIDVAMIILLLVTIVYGVKLNIRISGLRERDSELQGVIEQFNEASNRALDSVRDLKSAGLDVDQKFKASTDRAQALCDDLAYMIERGEKIADRMEHAPVRQRPTPDPASGPVEPQGPSRESADENRQYRSEIEQALAQVVRSTATVG